MKKYQIIILIVLGLLMVVSVNVYTFLLPHWLPPRDTSSTTQTSATTDLKTLSNATVGEIYRASLMNASSVTLSNGDQLPPGLTLQEVALPCAPPQSGQAYCPNEYDLVGTPTRSGAYTFHVSYVSGETATSSTQAYSLVVR